MGSKGNQIYGGCVTSSTVKHIFCVNFYLALLQARGANAFHEQNLFFKIFKILTKWLIEPQHEISNNVVYATSKGSDQPAPTRSLIRAFANCLNMLLTYHHLEFPSLKVVCIGSSEVTFVRVPHCSICLAMHGWSSMCKKATPGKTENWFSKPIID